MGHQSKCLCSFGNGAWSQFRLLLQYLCLLFICLSYLIFCFVGFVLHTVFSGLFGYFLGKYTPIFHWFRRGKTGYNKLYIHMHMYNNIHVVYYVYNRVTDFSLKIVCIWMWDSNLNSDSNYPAHYVCIYIPKNQVEDEWGHLFCCSFSETLPISVSYKSESQEEMLQVFNIDAHTSKQLRHFKFLSVSFMSQLLASNNFIRKVRCSFNVFAFSEGTVF